MAHRQVTSRSLRSRSGRGRAPEPMTPPLPTLLARHVPILVLHPAERFRPVPVDGFLADSDLQRRTGTGGKGSTAHFRWVRPITDWTSASAWRSRASRLLPAARRRLRIARRPPCTARPSVPGSESSCSTGSGTRSTTTARPFLPASSGRCTKATGRLSRWCSTFAEGRCSSDTRSTTKVFGATGLGHRRGLRPLSYVAIGSHANYPTPGKHRFDPRVVEPFFISIIEQSGFQPVDHTGTGRVVRPSLVRVSRTAPPWMAFAGRWGEDSYIKAPGGVPTAYAAAGPPGPLSRSIGASP